MSTLSSGSWCLTFWDKFCDRSLRMLLDLPLNTLEHLPQTMHEVQNINFGEFSVFVFGVIFWLIEPSLQQQRSIRPKKHLHHPAARVEQGFRLQVVHNHLLRES